MEKSWEQQSKQTNSKKDSEVGNTLGSHCNKQDKRWQ